MKPEFHYTCIHCGQTFPSDTIIYRCTDCEKKDTDGQPPLGMLKTVYDYATIKAGQTPEQTLKMLVQGRFLSLLPIKFPESLGFLKVGDTPLYTVRSIDGNPLGCELLLKDDSQNPTFSFKDRASVLVSAFARERNISTLVTASTGNAGSSLAGICAAQRQQAVILVPATAPAAKLTQIMMYGARLIPIDANYDTAFDLSIRLTEEFGWYNRNTAYNPLTIEGKKTVSFEIAVQTGLRLPDRIFVPCGDGVILSGVYKGFEDLLSLGIISHIPVIVAVQAALSDNLVRNFNQETFRSVPSNTLADSISVDIPRNFHMANQYHQQYQGEAMVVEEEEILQASLILSRNSGIFAEPAAATALAGFLKMKRQGGILPHTRNLVLLTGSGLKDLQAVKPVLDIPDAVYPDTAHVLAYLKTLS